MDVPVSVLRAIAEEESVIASAACERDVRVDVREHSSSAVTGVFAIRVHVGAQCVPLVMMRRVLRPRYIVPSASYTSELHVIASGVAEQIAARATLALEGVC
ncbi:MAG: hypothetical protein AAFV33_09480 [Chloroflexota bacterium]